MGFQEFIEEKGITSVSIHPDGKVILKNSFSKYKIFIGISTVIILLIAVIFIYYSCIEKKYEICTTNLCLESSLRLMNCMNETVNPCEEFYEFACGKFEINYPAYYHDATKNSWIEILSFKVEQEVKKFLTNINENYEPEAVHKARNFYNTCLSFTEGPVDNDYEPLRNVWNKLGLDTDYLNDSAPLQIETILAKIKIYFDIDVFLSIYVDDDPRNSSSHSLLTVYQIENPEKFENKNTKKSNKIATEETIPKFKENFKLIVDELLYYNQTDISQFNSEDLTNTTEELVNFSMNISKISINAYKFKSGVPEIFTLQKLQNLTDSSHFKFNWTLYIRELIQNIEPEVYEQLTLENSNTFEVLISNLNYVENVFKLLSETPTILIKMYILTQTVDKLYNYFIPSTENSKEDYCFSLTTRLFKMVTGYSMINSLDSSSKAKLFEMFNNIKLAFNAMVHDSSWMDDETKKATLRKLANTKFFYGYPNNYTNLLNNLYKDLNVTESHLENTISMSIFNLKNSWKYLTKEKDLENMEWDVTPDEVNAYNYHAMNALFIPAAFLQPPMYHNGLQSLNYGVMGSTMGHELSHNYDNTGRLYNELGNVAPWWTEKSQKEYSERADCLVRYYDSIEVRNNDQLHDRKIEVDGDLTLNENIADIAGLKEAYYAYRIYVNTHGQEPRLPGMEKYSPEQLFFLGYAYQFCHYDTDNNVFDNHSPNKVRVQGVLSLLPDFSKAWSCEIGTPMNPKTDEKCQIW